MPIEIPPNNPPHVVGGDIVIASNDPSWLGRTMPPCDPTYYQLLTEKKRGLDETVFALADDHELPTPRRAYQLCRMRTEREEENWLTYAVCYLTETMESIDDPAVLRKSVVACANVLVGWIAQLDREAAAQ